MSELARCWLGVVHQLGGEPDLARGDAAELERSYAASSRHYHGVEHIVAVLKDLAWLGPELALTIQDQALARAAACTHDIIYEAKPGEDERSSAEWARTRLLGVGVPAQLAVRVADLVLATLDHAASDDDPVASVLLDADLAILGSESEQYAKYAAAVRLEYASISEDAWRVGRTAVLSGLLNRRPLYRTAAARVRWDAQARLNIQTELDNLAG
ncbi:HD domain-containing protein [Jatrophihabitans sp. DSM 45814]